MQTHRWNTIQQRILRREILCKKNVRIVSCHSQVWLRTTKLTLIKVLLICVQLKEIGEVLWSDYTKSYKLRRPCPYKIPTSPQSPRYPFSCRSLISVGKKQILYLLRSSNTHIYSHCGRGSAINGESVPFYTNSAPLSRAADTPNTHHVVKRPGILLTTHHSSLHRAILLKEPLV